MSATDIHDPNRRDFLYIATGMAGVVGAGAVAWPFIDQMRPDASTLARAGIHAVTLWVMSLDNLASRLWGLGRREEALGPDHPDVAVSLNDLKDPIARNANLPSDAPATDANRTTPGKEAWMVMVQVCTHLGCIPLGQEGDFGGWFCPCHGSQYDTAGRIRKGPAPENMAIPVYQFISDTKIRIG